MSRTEKRWLKWRVLQVLSAGLGVIISVYLFVQHIKLRAGIQSSSSFCSMGKYADCDVVNSSHFSELGPIPIAALGAIFYFLMLILGLGGKVNGKSFIPVQRLIWVLAAVGLGVDALLLVVQLVSLQSFCTMCLSTYALTAICFWSADRLLKGDTSGISGFERAKYLRADVLALGKQSRSFFLLLVVTTVTFGSLLYVLPAYITGNSQNYQLVNNAMEQFFAEWKEKPAREITVNPGNGTYGDPSAKVNITVFSDFQCPFCKRAAFTVHTALSRLKNRVYLVFKNFPLDQRCNPAMTTQKHPLACSLAQLGVCSARKNVFWDFHDQIFLRVDEDRLQRTSDADLASVLDSIMTDAEVKSCLADSTTLDTIRADLQQGMQLEIRGTPAVFINGKAVTVPLTLETLLRLVEIEESLRK